MMPKDNSTPQTKLQPNGRVSRSERAIQVHVIRDPSLAKGVSEAIEPGRLHGDTWRMIEVATEFPDACRLAGILDVACSIAEPIEFLESLEELSGLPDWFASELPTFEAALEELTRPRLIAEAGALRQWQREVVAGKRSRFDADPLYDAACLEARARSEIRDGMIAAANDDRRKAAEIVATAGIIELQHTPAKSADPWQSVLPPVADVANKKGVAQRRDPWARVLP